MPIDYILKLRSRLIRWEKRDIIRYGSFAVILLSLISNYSEILYWFSHDFTLATPPFPLYVPFFHLASSLIFLLMLERQHLKIYFILPLIVSLIYSLFEAFTGLRSWGVI